MVNSPIFGEGTNFSTMRKHQLDPTNNLPETNIEPKNGWLED